MDAIVLAGGGTHPKDPLYTLLQGQNKSLLDLNGKPMIQWVLDALSGSQRIDRVIVAGLESVEQLYCLHPLIFLPDRGSLLDNIQSGADYLLTQDARDRHGLVVSSDIPAISPVMVDWVIDRVLESNHDIYYNVVTRATMEQAFPASRRTYVRLKNLEVCGGDLNAFRLTIGAGRNNVGQRIIAARKNPLRQAWLVGFGTLFLLLVRRLSLEQAVQRVGRRLGLSARALLCPYAEIAMDVDKPFQLEILRKYLSQSITLPQHPGKIGSHNDGKNSGQTE